MLPVAQTTARGFLTVLVGALEVTMVGHLKRVRNVRFQTFVQRQLGLLFLLTNGWSRQLATNPLYCNVSTFHLKMLKVGLPLGKYVNNVLLILLRDIGFTDACFADYRTFSPTHSRV
jgi:hypothetical protein